MPIAAVHGIDLVYEMSGDGSCPMLLIQGLAGQLISWDEGFCAELTERGFSLIRYDNRDAGLSTKFDHAGIPELGRAMAGEEGAAPYSIEDMAGDAAGLLDAIGVESAHVVGISMGGMIAQAMAIAHPSKVASLCSIMSTTGDRSVGAPTAEGLRAIFTTPPTNREEAIETGLSTWRVLWGQGYPLEEETLRRRIGALYDRGEHPMGVARQVAAIVSAEDRTEALSRLDVSALVIHGEDDPLITPSGGEATAGAIRGAVYLTIAGMGHSLPQPVWTTVCDAIAENAARAGATAPGGSGPSTSPVAGTA